MAEARSAVAEPLPSLSLIPPIDPKSHRPQVSLSGDGFSLFIPHPRFWPRLTVRLIKKGVNKMRHAFSPIPLSVVVVAEVGAVTWLMAAKPGSWIRESRLSHWVWKLDSRMPLAHKFSNEARVAYLAAETALGCMVGFTVAQRFFLRRLLSYTNWMHEVRGKKSTATLVWGALLKYIYMKRPLTPTLALQSCLPPQPVPPLKDTLERYLKSMETLIPPEEHAAVSDAAKKFMNAEGVKLQRYLQLKRWKATNYVSDWWLDVVYLRGRDSIMINSNYYGLSMFRPNLTSNQAARAATMIQELMKIKHTIDREELPRIMVQGLVPLCMQQYMGAFSMTREPGLEMDRLVQYDASQSRHITVIHKGRFFKVRVYDYRTGQLLSKLQLEAALNGILNAPVDATCKEHDLPALTAMNRTEWAEIRIDLFLRDKINRVALDTIEKSAFVVSLDDFEMAWDNLTDTGRKVLHGNGANRWFDKSFTLCVSTDGYVALNGEHSWADAPTLGHILEIAMCEEVKQAAAGLLYNEDGTIQASPAQVEALSDGKLPVYKAERIIFNVTPKLTESIKRAVVGARKAIDNLDLAADPFRAFGKGTIKKAKCSPDAFVQMALQLAYFRDQGKFTQTYESAMARLYREGRTETVRSATSDSAAFVYGMENGSASREDRLKLLQKACDTHTHNSTLCMTGKGVDRHMFALYVVAVGTQTESPFLKQALGRGWKLSTSQIPQMITDWKGKNDGNDYPRPAGGFGPVADDGYGVCYTFGGETMVFFHVSSNKSCPTTDSPRMWKRINDAMLEMAALIGAPEAAK